MPRLEIFLLLSVLFCAFSATVVADDQPNSVHKAVRSLTTTDRLPVSGEAVAQISIEIESAAHRHDIDPLLLASIISVESDFNRKARSSAGAVGLMQVMPKYHADTLKKTGTPPSALTSIRGGIAVGASIFKDLLARHRGDVVKALQSYNGSGSDRSLAYSRRVLTRYDRLKEAAEEYPN